MSDHLDERMIRDYVKRTLDPAALLAADDHLAVCPECRELAARGAASIGALRHSLTPPHLTQEFFEAYAEGRLTDVAALAHLAQCPECRTEADDLRQFVREGRRIARAHAPRGRWMLAAAIAACALIATGIAVTHRRRPAQIAAAPSTIALPPDLRDLRDAALESGRVAIPPEVAAQVAVLRGNQETQLGATPPASPELEAPVGTAVLSAHPEFRWQAVSGARSYQVVVFDHAGRPVISSDAVDQTSWTPPRDLDRGQTYFWELSIRANGSVITAPRPPAPQARFLVLAGAEQARLRAIAARFPREHVLLGVLYAQAGALDEARREFAADGGSAAARLQSSIP